MRAKGKRLSCCNGRKDPRQPDGGNGLVDTRSHLLLAPFPEQMTSSQCCLVSDTTRQAPFEQTRERNSSVCSFCSPLLVKHLSGGQFSPRGHLSADLSQQLVSTSSPFVTILQFLQQNLAPSSCTLIHSKGQKSIGLRQVLDHRLSRRRSLAGTISTRDQDADYYFLLCNCDSWYARINGSHDSHKRSRPD